MKILPTFLSVAAILIAASAACGFGIDAIVVFSSCFVAGISGLFVNDYSHKPDYRTESKQTSVVVRKPAPSTQRRRETSPVFASLIVFNTTIA